MPTHTLGMLRNSQHSGLRFQEYSLLMDGTDDGNREVMLLVEPRLAPFKYDTLKWITQPQILLIRRWLWHKPIIFNLYQIKF